MIATGKYAGEKKLSSAVLYLRDIINSNNLF